MPPITCWSHWLGLNGVAKAQVMGDQTYSMRIWLNPERMTALDITTSDIANALKEQNVIVAAGKLGQGPTLPDQQFEIHNQNPRTPQ